MRGLVNAHQRTDKGFGPALGPAAAARVADLDAEIKVGSLSPSRTIDPHKSFSVADWTFEYPVFDRLVQIDDNLQVQPMLAASWKFSSDGKQLLAHELTHALQDQNYGLEKWTRKGTSEKTATAAARGSVTT